MKRALLTLGLAMAASISTPSMAAVNIGPSQGQLSNHINGDDRDDGNANTVYGRTKTGGEVKFTANTAIDITSGFASVSDITPKEADFFWLIINPDEAFTQLDFSLQFLEASTFTVDYGLIGGGSGSLGILNQNSDKLVDYLISGTNGEVFDFIKITSLGSPIKFEKQNSIQLASNGGGTGGDGGTGAVPEPSTWAMMLLGFGAMGVTIRRRRRSSGKQMLQLA